MKKSLASLNNRVYCNNTCRYFEFCPMRDIAISKAKDKAKAGIKGEPECAFKDKPEYIQDAFENIYIKPLEEGLIDELKRFMMLLSMKAGKPSADVKEIKEAVDSLIKVYKALYVDIKKKEDSEITFNVQIINQKETHRVIDIPIEDYQLNDPESLFADPQ